jgi:hypothetical protein
MPRTEDGRNYATFKSMSNYDALSLRSARYARNRLAAEARRIKLLFTLLTPCPGEELAGNIATT